MAVVSAFMALLLRILLRPRGGAGDRGSLAGREPGANVGRSGCAVSSRLARRGNGGSLARRTPDCRPGRLRPQAPLGIGRREGPRHRPAARARRRGRRSTCPCGGDGSEDVAPLVVQGEIEPLFLVVLAHPQVVGHRGRRGEPGCNCSEHRYPGRLRALSGRKPETYAPTWCNGGSGRGGRVKTPCAWRGGLRPDALVWYQGRYR